jgi:diacylglycerol kinase
MKLWYIKKSIPNNNSIINRSSLTLIFAVMHYISELVRYSPAEFNRLLNTKQNWLVVEFLNMALDQFVDEISAELTHENIYPSKYR